MEGQFSDKFKKNFTHEDFRFTTAHGNLYAIALKGNDDGRYCIKSLKIEDFSKHANFGGIIEKVEVLGVEDTPVWEQTEEGLIINTCPGGEKPVTFKITLA